MANPLLGQVLGGIFGQALARRGLRGGMGGPGGAAVGGMLAGMRGRGHLGGPRAGLVLLLLPLAMRWVQRNGGMGAVLDRFRQKGYGGQMQSWVAAGDNATIDEQAVEKVVGRQELQAMAQRLGVPEHEVAQGLAEIVPELVDQLTPEGRLPQQADEVLEEGRHALEKETEGAQSREGAPS